MAVEAQRWWSQETVAVVTGANKGVGFEIVKQLVEKGITVVLTSRDVKRGEEATKKLVDQGLPVVYHQLEVTSPESAQKLADWLKQEYGYVDILVNNAGILELEPDFAAAVSSFEINFYGVKHVTKAILPLLRASEAGARIVNVSTRAAQFQYIENEEAKKILGNVEELSEEALDKLVNDFYDDVKQQKQSRWVGPLFNASYAISKATEIAYTRLLARELAHRPSGQKVYVNAFCPGYTTTDMAKSFLDKLDSPPEGVVYHEADEAAANAVWLILLPASESPSGVLSAERTVFNF